MSDDGGSEAASDEGNDDEPISDVELTPHDGSAGGPPPASLPKGPPPPRPVNLQLGEPMPGFRKRARDPEDHTSTDANAEVTMDRWERDHADGPQPASLVQEGGRRTIRRVSGPLLPDGSFMGRPEPDSSDSSSSDDSDDTGRTVVSPSQASQASYTWSISSLILEGPSLQHAQDRLVDIFRRQLLETEPDLGARQLGGRLGAMRRRFTSWVAVQDTARFRLQGTYLLEWQAYEHHATHERRRRHAEPADEPAD